MRFVALLLLLAACSSPVSFQLVDRQGVAGQARLSGHDEGSLLQLRVFNMPSGQHGLHIHEFGECVLPDFSSAGAHYNPEGRKHGLQNLEGYHAGDLPNLEVNEGIGVMDVVVPVSLRELKGKSIVIHQNADDMVTDQSGNSGARIACGVIE
ncbi:superoxide dismutase family protein [Candidatus Woesearchaeota archaeon]|nr:superoxide dismutase family protein [Candidatus Woesearchaeota archaeon]